MNNRLVRKKLSQTEQKKIESNGRMHERLVRRMLSQTNIKNNRGGIVVESGGGEKVVSKVVRTTKLLVKWCMHRSQQR